jgi:hypothetical protein
MTFTVPVHQTGRVLLSQWFDIEIGSKERALRIYDVRIVA